MTFPKIVELQNNQKVFFASDFHLGVPSLQESHERERKIIRWLESIQNEAKAIFLLGDIFDFWFEYKRAIPKGFVRLQGKLAELCDQKIPVIFFSGNHDIWMFKYFQEEIGVEIYHKPQVWEINQKKFLLGHGDGLGPGDHKYKFLKKVFRNPFFQWLFARFHPNFGIGIAQIWSKKSKQKSYERNFKETFLGSREWLWQYSKEIEKKEHHDFYIFGHRHLVLDLEVGEQSRYINLGTWLYKPTYGYFDGKKFCLTEFEEK